MRTHSPDRAGQQKLARIHLVARVQVAYEQVRDAARRHHTDPAHRRALETARRRLAALNFALALLSLQGT